MPGMDHAGFLRELMANIRRRPALWIVGALLVGLIAWRAGGGCSSTQMVQEKVATSRPATVNGAATQPFIVDAANRRGDEIVVCGRLFHIGTPVVLWCDRGGYDGYAPSATTQPSILYGSREDALSGEQAEQFKRGGWDLPLVQAAVRQFVIHYDAAGTSRECFTLLHEKRGLSVHFLLDLDGTIYQTLDLRERAWHATTANGRSIGIEIANRGAVPTPTLLAEWYSRDAKGLRITIPSRLGDGGIRTPGFVGRPATDHIIRGIVQGQLLYQYDFTPQQYEALIRLTATVCRVLPRIACDYPRDGAGKLITTKLPDDVLAGYCGLLGHYHIQRDKQDPGPAFDWDRVIGGATQLMAEQNGQIQ